MATADEVVKVPVVVKVMEAAGMMGELMVILGMAVKEGGMVVVLVMMVELLGLVTTVGKLGIWLGFVNSLLLLVVAVSRNCYKCGGSGTLEGSAQMVAVELEHCVKVEAYNTERALRKIKCHPTSVALDGSANVKVKQEGSCGHKGANELPRDHVERSKMVSEVSNSQSNDGEAKSSELGGDSQRDAGNPNFIGEPASWDPYSKGVDLLKASLASHGTLTPKKQKSLISEKKPGGMKPEEPPENITPAPSAVDASKTGLKKDGEKTLKDAVKPKQKRKKRASSIAEAS